MAERYSDDPAGCLAAAGVDLEDPRRGCTVLPLPPDTLPLCIVCCEDTLAPADMVFVSCGHMFCRSCWVQHVQRQVTTGHATDLRCMHPGCRSLLDFSFVRAVCPEDLCRAFVTSFVMAFGDSHRAWAGFMLFAVGCPIDTVCVYAFLFVLFLCLSFCGFVGFCSWHPAHIKYCPSKDCSLAMRVTSSSTTDVACPCGTKFCFKCAQEAHAPAPCNVARQWGALADLDALTMDWVENHTQTCPACHVPVEKMGSSGVLWMQCRCGTLLCVACVCVLDLHMDGHSRLVLFVCGVLDAGQLLAMRRAPGRPSSLQEQRRLCRRCRRCWQLKV